MATESNYSLSGFTQELITKNISRVNPLIISVVGAGGKTTLLYRLAQAFKDLGHDVCVTTTTKMYLPTAAQVDNISDLEHLSFAADPSVSFIYQRQLKATSAEAKTKVCGLSIEQLTQLKQQQKFTVFLIEADGAHRLPIKAPAEYEPCLAPDSDVVIGVIGAKPLLQAAKPDNIHRWAIFSQLTECCAGDIIGKQQLSALLKHPSGLFKGCNNCNKQQQKIWLINQFDLAADKKALLAMAQQLFFEQPELSLLALTQMTANEPIKHMFKQSSAFTSSPIVKPSSVFESNSTPSVTR